MKIISASTEILDATPYLEQTIEEAGRVCYKSEDRITEDSAAGFIERLAASEHESVLEHGSITVKFICDRGVSHELVRHRLASFSQESTRYCNYSKDKFGNELTFIRPCFFKEGWEATILWQDAMANAEQTYLDMLKAGASPQEARSVLPNSLKTEIVVTANPREWKHIFKLRCATAAHPQMREVMIPLQAKFAARWPAIFGGSDNA
ncbi:FAD-dependent thymidylate synthase [Telmatospirillum sp.]|uniref:FAD-dependent thymidylate synthase n=1 Tax=Telmatospirillum sp. TaxID=2079197 RepID=UPI00283EB4DA|nr:FAD-dependent thymidylate synthase [Telmatospirillum sp.]MDR3436464.1 FAD-dependent thymidylate synthase [Telmatospirillum sp.]